MLHQTKDRSSPQSPHQTKDASSPQRPSRKRAGGLLWLLSLLSLLWLPLACQPLAVCDNNQDCFSRGFSRCHRGTCFSSSGSERNQEVLPPDSEPGHELPPADPSPESAADDPADAAADAPLDSPPDAAPDAAPDFVSDSGGETNKERANTEKDTGDSPGDVFPESKETPGENLGDCQPYEGISWEGMVSEGKICAGQFLWAQAVAQSQYPPYLWGGLALDQQGEVYIAGQFTVSASFGQHQPKAQGMGDVFVARMARDSGKVRWVTSLGGGSNDGAFGLAVGPKGDLYLTGGFASTATFGRDRLSSKGGFDIFVAKVSSQGQPLWARSYGGSAGHDMGRDIAVDPQGNVYVVGYFNGTVTFGSKTHTAKGSADTIVLKLDSQGTLLWATPAGGPDNDYPTGITADSQGQSFLTGSFGGTPNSSSSPTSATFGQFTLNSQGNTDCFVASLSPKGVFRWATPAQGTDHQWGSRIRLDGHGHVYLAGLYRKKTTFGQTTLTSPSSSDQIFVAKLNPSGQFQWATSANTPLQAVALALTLDPQSNVYVTGYTSGETTFGSQKLLARSADAFLARVNTQGAFDWATLVGGSGADRGGYGIAFFPGAGLFWAGSFLGNASLGSFRLSGSGTQTFFVSRLVPPLP